MVAWKKMMMAAPSGGGFPTTEEAILTPSNGTGDEYGFDCTLSPDGTRAVVGQPKNPYVYVYIKSGSTWSEEAKLRGSDSNANDGFGLGIAIDSDGDTIAVGAPYDDDNGNSSGAVYIFTRSGTTWTQQAKLTGSGTIADSYLGYSCSLSDDGNTLASGCLFDTGNVANSGSVRIFTRSGSSWSQQAKLYISGPSGYNGYGSFVSLSSDGNLLAAGTSGGTGYLGIHSRSGSSWSTDQTISAPVSNKRFGATGALSRDKSTILVCAGQAGTLTWQGLGYIYTESGGTWSLQATLSASNAQAYDRLGNSGRVSLTSDGNIAALGSPYADNSGGTSVGSAYIFSRSGTSWSEEQILLASDITSSVLFAEGVKISEDGSTLIAGARQQNSSTGAAYIFV